MDSKRDSAEPMIEEGIWWVIIWLLRWVGMEIGEKERVRKHWGECLIFSGPL